MWRHQNSILTLLCFLKKIPVTVHENFFSCTSTAQFMNWAIFFLPSSCTGQTYYTVHELGIRGAQFMNWAISQIGRNIYIYHLSTIKKNTISPIPDHFNSKDHSIDHLEIACVEKIRDHDMHLRKVRETFWIQKLNTLHPHGLNRNVEE